MNKASSLLAAAVVTALGALSFGCSSPCDTLKTTCARCTAPHQLIDMTECQDIVAQANGTACQNSQMEYDTWCP